MPEPRFLPRLCTSNAQAFPWPPLPLGRWLSAGQQRSLEPQDLYRSWAKCWEARSPCGVWQLSSLGGEHIEADGLSPGTDAPAPPHKQTPGQPNWVWAPYGLQSCPHPKLMEGGLLVCVCRSVCPCSTICICLCGPVCVNLGRGDSLGDG